MIRRLLASTAALAVAAALLPSLAQAQQSNVPQSFRGVSAQGPLWSSTGGSCPSPQHLVEAFDLELIATGCRFDDFELMGRAGVDHLRLFVPWMTIQPTADTDLDRSVREKLDPIVLGTARQGIRVQPFFVHTPAWVQTKRRPDDMRPAIDTPAERRHYRHFVRTLAARYGTRGTLWPENPGVPRIPIRQWQVLNEVNSPNHFSPRPHAGRYAQALRVAASGIRAADPRADIVLAGLFFSPGGGNLRHAMTSVQFLQRLYRQPRIKRFFDSVAVHPYSPNLEGMRLQLNEIRRVMNRNKDRRTPIRITELGWSSDRPGDPGVGRQAKGPRGQSQMMSRAWRVLANNRSRWRLRSVSWFSWQDAPHGAEVGACSFCYGSGLVEYRDRTVKPAFNTFSKLR